MDLASLHFCDARGLSALLRMASYAELADRPFGLASPSPMLVKLLRIAALDHKLLEVTGLRSLEQRPDRPLWLAEPSAAAVVTDAGDGRSPSGGRCQGRVPGD